LPFSRHGIRRNPPGAAETNLGSGQSPAIVRRLSRSVTTGRPANWPRAFRLENIIGHGSGIVRIRSHFSKAHDST